jgi:hypothetical protein
MNKRKRVFLPALVVGLAIVEMVGCGGNTIQSPAPTSTSNAPPGSLIVFGTDAPICDVESFSVVITDATLLPQGTSGSSYTIITSKSPATVDFARLVDFTTLLTSTSVTQGTYDKLQLTLTSPQLTVLQASPPGTPMTPQTLTTTFAGGSTTDTLTVNINPALTVNSSGTAGLVMDFNLRQSVVTNSSGQVTGVVTPQLTLTPSTASNGQLGEADTLYGVVVTPTTACTTIPSAVGCFSLQAQAGVGQTYTIQVTSTTDFEGDGVSGLSGSAALAALATGTFVEVDAIIDTSGNIIAQEVDAEVAVAASNQGAGFLGEVIGVTYDGSGNATQFNLLVQHETRDVTNEVPLQSSLTVNLQSTTFYWSNWHRWNRHALRFGPKTLGVAEMVAVFGTLQAGTPPTLTAEFVFLRQQKVLGNFTSLLAAGSDDKTGGFTLVPCGPIFQGLPITVLTFDDTKFRGVAGLNELTKQPTLNVAGLLFYEQTNGPAQQPTWTAPTWVMQAKTVRQLPQ